MLSKLSFSLPKMIAALALLTVLAGLVYQPASGGPGNGGRSPAEDPPMVAHKGDTDAPQDTGTLNAPTAIQAAPTTEWTYHKTADSAHPNGNEQQAVWLMNRARSNPTQEGIWLATSSDPQIAGGRVYFGVNLTLLQSEFAGYDAKPPAAFDVRLYNAAKAHSDDLIARDAQDHTGQIERVIASGFPWTYWRGNVFSYASSSLNAHAAWNIDWGYAPDGMQSGRGHRKAIMSLDGAYTNVGLALVHETNPGTRVGPYVSTGNYCAAQEPAGYNRFIVGTVWQDLDGDQFYDPGEGIGGVTVTPNSGTYYAVTANSGGYAIPITAAGIYQVTFSGALSGERSVVVGSVSALLDFLYSPELTEKVYLPMTMN
jgi:hypothetical protein